MVGGCRLHSSSTPHHRVPAPEIVAGLSLATDLGIGARLQYGLQSTVTAMGLCERLGVDRETARQVLLRLPVVLRGVHRATAEIVARVFGDEHTLTSLRA